MRPSLVSLRGAVSSVVGAASDKAATIPTIPCGGGGQHTPLLRVAAMQHELPCVLESLRSRGIGAIVDYAREHQPPTETSRVANVIECAIESFPEAMHAMKLSALGLEQAPTAAGRSKNVSKLG